MNPLPSLAEKLGLHELSLLPPSTLHFPHSFAVGQTAQPKVWLTSETAKDVANVVGRFDSLLESAAPAIKNALHDWETRIENVLNCDTRAILFENKKVFVGGNALGRPVKVGA